ncbi:MAG: hypothetical protein KGJ27_03785 [candidate division NC10 bacterium]|nr:hypothetical protein [candidate division NC10 bacterium]
MTKAGLGEYEKGMVFFYSGLVELNIILDLAERIINFPFDLFVFQDRTIFFTMVMQSFYDSAILIITRLATDQKGNVYTLRRFKNRVKELVKPEFKTSFEALLKKARFDATINNLLKRAEQLRTHRIAHTTQDWILGKVRISRPNISELQALRTALNSLFDALSFEVKYNMLPLAYDPRVLPASGGKEKTDIEELLDCIARNSRLLNMPETHPDRWSRRRARLTGDQIKQVNHYRRKFNLSEV